MNHRSPGRCYPWQRCQCRDFICSNLQSPSRRTGTLVSECIHRGAPRQPQSCRRADSVVQASDGRNSPDQRIFDLRGMPPRLMIMRLVGHSLDGSRRCGASRAIIIAPRHRSLKACRIEPFYSAVDVDLADTDIVDVVAMGTIEFQRQLPILAETLHIHLDAGGRLSARIRTSEEEACHSDLLRALKE
jgi:hypothetical protein